MEREVVSKYVGKTGPTVVFGAYLGKMERKEKQFPCLRPKLRGIIPKEKAGDAAFTVPFCIC